VIRFSLRLVDSGADDAVNTAIHRRASHATSYMRGEAEIDSRSLATRLVYALPSTVYWDTGSSRHAMERG
jgi:hypothetical protein